MPWVRFTSMPAAHEALVGRYIEGGEYELDEASVVRWERRRRVVRIDGPSGSDNDMASVRPVSRRMQNRAPAAATPLASDAILPQLNTTSEQLPPRPQDAVTVTIGKKDED